MRPSPPEKPDRFPVENAARSGADQPAKRTFYHKGGIGCFHQLPRDASRDDRGTIRHDFRNAIRNGKQVGFGGELKGGTKGLRESLWKRGWQTSKSGEDENLLGENGKGKGFRLRVTGDQGGLSRADAQFCAAGEDTRWETGRDYATNHAKTGETTSICKVQNERRENPAAPHWVPGKILRGIAVAVTAFCAAQLYFPADAHGAAQKAIAKELQFEVPKSGAEPVTLARVEVARISRKPASERSSSWISFQRWRPYFVAEGVQVRLQNNDFSGLRDLPAKLEEKSKVKNLEMHHLSLYAPGDTVPRLIAKEVTFHPNGIWRLQRVLLSGRPSLPSCILRFDGKNDLVLSAPSKAPISLRRLFLNKDSL